MTKQELIDTMADPDCVEHLKFERVENKRNRRSDLHAFLLLDSLQPSEEDIIAASEHDEFWLSIDVEKLAEVITREQAIELVRCGVRYDEDTDSLAMFS